MCESGKASAFRVLAEWESKIANHKKSADCLHGLNPEQRQQLSALLVETIDAFEGCKRQGARSQMRRQLADEASRRTRMLDRKLEKARKAVKELEDYTGDPDERSVDPLSDARQILSRKYGVAAQRALRELDVQRTTPKEIGFYESLRSEYETPERVEGFGMVKLYWFFRHGCGLTGDESEVRVARLRNAFWTEHGMSRVEYRRTYRDGESRGCEAVHVAVRRWRP
jgi:hypothetical protein